MTYFHDEPQGAEPAREITPPFAVGDVVRRATWLNEALTAEVVEVVKEVRYHLVCRGSWAPDHDYDVQHVDVPDYVKVDPQ